MDTERKKQLSEIREELRQLVDMIHEISVKEAALGRRLDPIEKAAMELRDDRVSFAVRDAYISLINAGRMFTHAHLDLNVPPTVFLTEQERGERAA